MFFMTEELKNELYPASEVEGPGRFKRLDRIKRTSVNFLYAYDAKRLGEYITDIHEPIQDIHDLYNEFRGLFIKTLMCDYLAAKHALALSLELSLLFINVVTLSWDKVPESVVDVLAEATFTLGYLLNSIVTEATVVPIFLLRCAMTLVNALAQLFASKEEVRGLYRAYALTQMNDIESPITLPVAIVVGQEAKTSETSERDDDAQMRFDKL